MKRCKVMHREQFNFVHPTETSKQLKSFVYNVCKQMNVNIVRRALATYTSNLWWCL